jgi:glycosyltransferase involved in cell wall biosynthesis
VPSDRIHFSPHSIDGERFDPTNEVGERAREWRRGLGIDDDATVVLFAGKFETKKRPLDLLRAFELCSSPEDSNDGHEAVLLYVGSGELEADLRIKAADRLGRDVFIVPFQNQSMMPLVYSAGSLFVLPSMGPAETWGLVVNEAMSMERAVIVSSHVGCGPDLVRNGATGWVFQAGDVGALATVLSDAIRDSVRLAEMGRNARSHVAGYSYEVATNALCAAVAQSLHRVES